MVAIKSRDTSIEVKLRKMLWDHGIRYRKNYKALPGSPDIVLTRYRIAIFCDGEFFHGKDWDKLTDQLMSGNNGPYWVAKIARNIDRDDEVNKQLIAMGWTVLRFWGRDILKYPDECLRAIEETIFENELRQHESDAGRHEFTEEDAIEDPDAEE